MASKLLRGWEKRPCLRKSAGLVVSSPGFITNYFDTLEVELPPVILAENKQMLVDGSVADRHRGSIGHRRGELDGLE